MERLFTFIPGWLTEWFRVYVLPFLRVQVRWMIQYMGKGVIDALTFLSLPILITAGSHLIWDARYQLTTTQQQQVARWASIAQLIAYVEDVPPVVPLVLWYKENGLRANNPANCEGIMGLYSAVSTGKHPCFIPGPIQEPDIAYQLRLGTRIFKEHCPEIHYTTTNPNVLKRCYLYYNAGPRTTITPDESGYVMNGYDAAHQNMVLTDVYGRNYRLQALGAWPMHIIIQTQLAQTDSPSIPPLFIPPLQLGQELVDRVWVAMAPDAQPGDAQLDGQHEDDEVCEAPHTSECLVMPHTGGLETLRPEISPLLLKPSLRSAIHCGLLPGVDMVSAKPSIVLAPMAGYLTRYTDEYGHLAIKIENEEWMIWLTGLRSYTAPQGEIQSGAAIGAVGISGGMTPPLHYVIYDKIKAGFVNPLSFVPAQMCPPAG